MRVCIFLGPTLSPDDARAELDALYLPPASQGDIYRAACRKPRAIGLIDGFFECVPAVWHKEILWAMSQGIHVYGCSSMGALRAAELSAFGMEGVGKIFEAYRNGSLEDDDEVAVAHAPADRGFEPTSEAMANIRATLAAAQKAGVIQRTMRIRMERIAKDLYYAERSYPRILECAAGEIRNPGLEAFHRWLPAGKVDQKREDAVAMLRRMRARLDAGLRPKHVRYSFQHTVNWELVRSSARPCQIAPLGSQNPTFLERLLDELRLEEKTSFQTRRSALLRLLTREEASRQGMVPGADLIAATGQRFRREREIEDPGKFERWLAENNLSKAEFLELMKDEACLEWVQVQSELEASALVPDQLRVQGEYARLAKRAHHKQCTLESRGLENPDAPDAGITEDELLRRYFEQRLGSTMAADLAEYCRDMGFQNESSFRRAILREYCYTGFSK